MQIHSGLATFAARLFRTSAAAMALAFAGGLAHAGELFADAVKSSVLGMDLRFNVYLPDGYKDGSGR